MRKEGGQVSLLYYRIKIVIKTSKTGLNKHNIISTSQSAHTQTRRVGTPFASLIADATNSDRL